MATPRAEQLEAVLEGESVYARVYQVLVLGMISSTVLFALGLFRALASHETVPLTRRWIREQYHWDAYWHALARGEASALLMTATALLILTPVLRVAVSVWAFSVERDRKFVAVTGTVLAIICLTVLLARAGLVSPEGVRPPSAQAPTATRGAP
jgi:uncharacterized membrane protein